MRIDTFEVRWRVLKIVGSKKKSGQDDDWYELVRYKEAQESLEGFIESTKAERHVVSLDYFINCYSLTQNVNLNFSSIPILDIPGHYLNNVSFPWNAPVGEINYFYEKMLLRRILGQQITIQDFRPIVEWEVRHKGIYQEILAEGGTKEQLAEELYRDEMEFGEVDFYGCYCRDKVCGGYAILVTDEDDCIEWTLPIPNHRKYRFDKKQYYQAFQDLNELIEKRMKNNFG
jgi:hypothetical protein